MRVMVRSSESSSTGSGLRRSTVKYSSCGTALKMAPPCTCPMFITAPSGSAGNSSWYSLSMASATARTGVGRPRDASVCDPGLVNTYLVQ